ncbi:MAG: hypothetical protein ACREQL_01465 [Candidatus Binatia bacterium]
MRRLPDERLTRPAMLRLDPARFVLGVRLALEAGDEPAGMVLQVPDEDRDLRMGAGHLVDPVGREEEAERDDERGGPGEHPAPVDAPHLALMPRERS